jgi:hypothetical protein
MPRLRACFEPDGDGSGKLSVEVSAPPFAGASSAWFGVEQLIEFAEQLAEAYPLSPTQPISLRGGFFEATGSTLETVHIGLSFYPLGNRGVVGCKVHLAAPVQIEDEHEARLEIELVTYYESVGRFARALSAISRGEAEEATLECAEG